MTGETVTREIRELMGARSAFYRMLAALYFQPLAQRQLEAMDLDGAAGALEEVPGVGEGLGLMAAGFGRRHTGTRRELAVDFTTSFGGVGVLDERTALPCKSVFVGEDGLLFGDEYFKVFEAYKASRVRKVGGDDMPDDHLSFMFEFMALLSDRVSDALAAGDEPSARADLESSRAFLAEHIASWFPLLAERAGRMVQTDFYRGVLQATQGFLDWDGGALFDAAALLAGE